ncbi:lysine-specific demethylase 3B-like isoform X2 [Homalodisca vitripennis]|uniref:lysine-specific demethylase 3B-like isoform X2 n=1 Tax=Homalodisca vitripennis TaxID=197043 RepID=UPI001EEA0144|nr:lysine-specific demethylase 3B-like isoform X2 [Homalodisca vitripennis]
MEPQNTSKLLRRAGKSSTSYLDLDIGEVLSHVNEIASDRLYDINNSVLKKRQHGGNGKSAEIKRKKPKTDRGKLFCKDKPNGALRTPIQCNAKAEYRIEYLKKAGETFIQDGACSKVAPKLSKCQECKSALQEPRLSPSKTLCRFDAFRRLRYTKNGNLATAGFLDPNKDVTQKDLSLWLPQHLSSSISPDMESSLFLLLHVSSQFYRLLEQEREAITINMAETKIVAWKRMVQGVREICDVCKTALFNYHWVCHKCGFVVCIDCYKSRKNGLIKKWLLCTNGRGHNQETLMLTQIVPADCLETLGLKLQQFQDTYSIPLSTTANYEKSAITMPSSVKITKEVVKQQENIETLEQVRRSSKNNQVIHVRTNQQHYFSEPEQGKEGLDVFKGFDDQINEEQGQLKQVLSYPHCNQILDDNSKLLKESFEIENMEKMKLLLNGVQYPNNNHNINEITLSHMVGDFDIEKIEVDLLQKSIKTYEWDMLMGNIPSKIIKGNILQKFDNYSDKTCTEKKSIFSNLMSEGCKNNNFLRNKIIQQPVMGYSADKVIYGDRLMTESSLKNCKIDQSMPEGMTLKTYVEQFSDIGNHKEDIINYKVGYQILDERIVPDLPRYPQNNIIQADLHLQAEGNPYGSIEKQLVKCVGNGQSSLQLPEEDSNNQQIVNKTSILTAGFPKNSLMILQKDVEHSDNNQLIIFKSISSVIEEKNDKANSKKQPDNNLSALIKDSWTFLQDACPLTPTKSKELFPDVPHSWLCGGRLLHLHKSNHPGNFKLFQDQWRRGQPVLVSDVTKHLDQDLWHPESFARDFGDIRNVLVDCMTGRSVHSHLMREFWEGFKHPERRLKDEDGNPMLLKLKDWPPGDDFAEMLPSRYMNLMSALPMSEYTSRSGPLNLVSCLPDCFVPPDLGPKMYSAYGSALYPSKGSTNLHLDVSDAVNVLVYVGISNDSLDHSRVVYRVISEACADRQTRRVQKKTRLPGALWHIYAANDAAKIRALLSRVAAERGRTLESHQDPIHDQTWYLDNKLRGRLLTEYGVEGYTIVQCLGDAIFIPAGAPHQVQNLNNCIKVAEDFVSPENISHCFHLMQEFRKLSDVHLNHEDKLQVKNIIYHAVKDALSVLPLE